MVTSSQIAKTCFVFAQKAKRLGQRIRNGNVTRNKCRPSASVQHGDKISEDMSRFETEESYSSGKSQPLVPWVLVAGAKKLSSIWQKIKHFEMLQHFSFAGTSTPHVYHRPGWWLDKNARSFFLCCDFLWTLFLESGVVLSPLQKLPLLSKAINLQNMTTLMLKKK